MMTRNPPIQEVRFVLQNLRQKSKDELDGLHDWEPETFARFLHSREGFHWVGHSNGAPAALIGAYRQRAGLWSLYGFGTDAWADIWRAVTVTAKRDMMPMVLATEARRADCLSLADHRDTHRWLNHLGASHRAEMPQYGRNGQDYVLFSWLRES